MHIVHQSMLLVKFVTAVLLVSVSSLLLIAMMGTAATTTTTMAFRSVIRSSRSTNSNFQRVTKSCQSTLFGSTGTYNTIRRNNMNNNQNNIQLALQAASSASSSPSVDTASVDVKHSSSSSSKKCRIGIFGGGTVGGGIVEILQKKKEYFYKITNGCDIDIVTICVNDINKKRDFTIPHGTKLTTNYNDILLDDSINMIIEVMGGTDDSKNIIWSALQSRKDVVTANKALIAKHLPEIESILKQVNSEDKEQNDNINGNNQRKKNVEFRYEAAVCGGIPIIRSLQTDYVGDEITMFSGIINGCTNYMLTAMDQNGLSYDEALTGASKLGYAEADPTLDVGGFDARSKLRILIRLAFGVDVDEDQIACRGITELSKLDFAYAKMMGGTIKLIGCAKTTTTTTTTAATTTATGSTSSASEKVAAFVSPCYISGSDALASVNGATNAIEIISNNLQCSTYIGQGAGRYPTANSCVNDIISIIKGDTTSPEPFNPSEPYKKFVQDFESVFYIRLRYKDQVGITRQCGEICEKHNVSIHSILQNPITRRDDAAFVLVTEKVPLAAVKKVCADIEELDWCNAPTFYMPVLREDWVEAMGPN